MSKFTPGPWRITGNMTKYVEARLESGWVQEVCAVGPTAVDSGYGETQAANARLIAAAPDLLEALMGCIAAIERTHHCTEADRLAAADIARAAIARATQ